MASPVRLLTVGLGTAEVRQMRTLAGQSGAEMEAAETLADGLAMIADESWSATLIRVAGEAPDPALIDRLAREPRAGALILVADTPSPELAMQAMGAGVRDVWVPPLEPGAIEDLVRSVCTEGDRVPLPRPTEDEGGLVGTSPDLLEAFKTVGRVAASPASVLVTGESGTGKELVAAALHRWSPRSARPFVPVNCAAIPEDLLESELFGHERGAFTGAVARKVGRFERAHGGTLFLDEIGDMSLVLQAKILRALQERVIERLGGNEGIPVDVRVVAATHRDLQERIGSGAFREDLYYRLAVVRVHLPPLRERGMDMRDLALHFAGRFTRQYGAALTGISSAALERLERHHWPGNVRELRNVLEGAVLAARGETLREEHLRLDPPRLEAAAPGQALPGYRPDLSMEEVEALHIARVLESVDHHFGRAADILGMHRVTVSRKAQQYGLV